MHKDYKKRHIETETKFYTKVNRKGTFLISMIFAGIGSIILYQRFSTIGGDSCIKPWIWTLIVIILFIAQTLIGQSIFEYERKKYSK